MPCPNNFLQLVPNSIRMQRALTLMRDGGLARDLATAVVALSEGETNVVWGAPRPLDPEDDCCGQIIGVERRFFHQYVGSDAETIAWLQADGKINWNSAESRVEPAGDLANPTQPEHAMLFFEYLVANEKTDVLRTLSIGPTQISLANSPSWCGYPADLDALWQFYSETNLATMVLRDLRYLVPARYTADGCLPADFQLPAGSAVTSLPWLQRHAGNASWANQVYHGGPLFPGRRPYADSWAQANSIAAQVFV